MLGMPILFFHERPGYDEKPFYLIKFCTIHPDTKTIDHWGHFLRKSSLDELPQFLNILRGEMSFVGPRPLLNDYLDTYTPEQKKRHHLRPGITGLAQVKGRNQISLAKKIEYDLKYVQKISFWMDFKILLHTLLQIVKLHEADGHVIETPEIHSFEK